MHADTASFDSTRAADDRLEFELRQQIDALQALVAAKDTTISQLLENASPARSGAPPAGPALANEAGPGGRTVPRLDFRNLTESQLARETVRLLRPYVLPQPSAANPVRRAWISGKIDWHDLVPDVYALKDDDAATKVLQRMRREAAKEKLLALLMNFDSPQSTNMPCDESDAGHAACETVQQWLVHQVRSSLGGADAAWTDVVRGVSNSSLIEALSAAAHVDRDDISPFRVPESDHGPFAKQAACGTVRDRCMIHGSARACVDDEYCGWCESSGVCLDRTMQYWPEKQAGTKKTACSAPLLVTADSVPSEYVRRYGASAASSRPGDSATVAGKPAQPQKPSGSSRAETGEAQSPLVYKLDRSIRGSGSMPRIPATQCSFIITRRRPLVLAFNNDNSKMAYHFFTETAPGWLNRASDKKGLQYLQSNVYVPLTTWTEFPQMVAPFSDSCPLIIEDLRTDITVCYAADEGPVLGGNVDGADRVSVSPGDGAVLQPTALQIFGLADPQLARIEYVDAASGAAADGSGNSKAVVEQGSATRQAHTEAVREIVEDPSSVLEPVLTSVAYGKRVGLAGIAALLRYFASGSHFLAPQPALFPRNDPGWTRELLNSGVEIVAKQLRSSGRFTEYLLQSMLLHSEGPSRNAPPLVTFISRRNKRFLFNEPDFVRVALALGAEVRVVALETTPLYEQMKLLRRTVVLVGMHGSGLINTQVMRSHTSVIQLVPWGVKGAAGFFQGTANGNGVSYHEVRQTDRGDTVPHFHFLDSSHAKDHTALFADGAKGSDCCGQQVFFSFWINQDGAFDAVEFGRVLKSALDGWRSKATA